MEYKVLFWALIIVAGLQALGLYMIGQSIKTLLKSESFRKRLLNKEGKTKDPVPKGKGDVVLKNTLGLLLLIGLSVFSKQSLALSVEMSEQVVAEPSFYSRTAINILLAINCIMAGMLLYAKSLFNSFFRMSVSKARLAKRKRKKRIYLHKILTDAVPLSEEEKILLNHDYDGITELDNNLPPWWKWGFYLTIVVAIFYMINYHVLKISPLQIEEYEIAITEAQMEVETYLKEQALNVDENSVVFLDTPAAINAGHTLFTKYCIACHLEGGGGVVGPNLTDDYWLYGDKINNVFKTIKYGANNGMKSWKDELNPVQMQQVASYILTLRGTKPPSPKAPEGEYYPRIMVGEEEDTTTVTTEITDTIALMGQQVD